MRQNSTTAIINDNKYLKNVMQHECKMVKYFTIPVYFIVFLFFENKTKSNASFMKGGNFKSILNAKTINIASALTDFFWSREERAVFIFPSKDGFIL